MISAYDAIFSGIPFISCTLGGIVLLSLLVQKQAILARSIVFSFQFWIAALYYFTYMAIVQRISAIVVIAGCLELLVLIIYLFLFKRLFVVVSGDYPQHLPKMLNYLKTGTWFVFLVSIPLYLQAGSGIFSEGSRLDILADSRWNIYLVYISSIVQTIMVPLVAAIVNAERRWRRSVLLYLALISVLSVLGASKGVAVLTLFAIVSLLKFERARDYFRVLMIPICLGGGMLSATLYFVGKFMSLEPSEMISIMFSRFFLSNDCRALAIDWSGYLNHNVTSVFRESFRLYATLFGNAPEYLPLGQILYTLQFGSVGMVGANTTATALLIAYGSDFGKILFVLLLAGAALGIGLLSDIRSRWDLPKLAIGISLLSLLSQDFLAFQVCMNILAFFLVAFLMRAILIKMLKIASASGAEPQRLTDTL